jgi:hypothetical protein
MKDIIMWQTKNAFSTNIWNVIGGMFFISAWLWIIGFGVIDISTQAQMNDMANSLSGLNIFGQLQETSQIAVWITLMQLCKIAITILAVVLLARIWFELISFFKNNKK